MRCGSIGSCSMGSSPLQFTYDRVVNHGHSAIAEVREALATYVPAIHVSA